MARKKKFAPNDNNLAIAYYRFSSHSQNDASSFFFATQATKATTGK